MGFYYEKVRENLPNCKLYIVGCKADLEKAVTREMVKSKYKALRYFETSAKLDKGVLEAFTEVEKDLLSVSKSNIGIMSL